ncbi:MAG: phosphate acetyltransferase [Bifidobacteriaceae bacterium]|nr:phosphate acetyltransferase [Bifidobacteriaceae bacterium]
MARSVYITSAEPNTIKSIVALGLVETLKRTVERVGVFRPILRSDDGSDHVLDLLKARDTIEAPREARIGATYAEYHADKNAALAQIIRRYDEFRAQCDAVVVIGSDYTDIPGSSELAMNGEIAANLGVPTILVLPGRQYTPDQVVAAYNAAKATLEAQHAAVIGVVANRCPEAELPQIEAALKGLGVPSAAIPDSRIALAPTLESVVKAVRGRLIAGPEAALGREVLDVAVGAMEVEHVLERLTNGSVVITPGDRVGVLLGVASAAGHGGYPDLTGLILGGGYVPDDSVMQLAQSLVPELPIIATDIDTLGAAAAAAQVHGQLDLSSQDKVDAAFAVFADHVDAKAFLQAVQAFTSPVVTPMAFQASLLRRAKADLKHIVLPEGEDDRILQAADQVVKLGAAKLTILGKPDDIHARAQRLGLDLTSVNVVDPAHGDLIDHFAEVFAELRKSKGMTLEQARDTIAGSATYFATMMVHTGMADGMVSGACHTTADTIRPSFQIIKTSPGVEIVSSVFLMALADKVMVFGDCAVNPNPTPSQLASIAISSAKTAAAFGVEPKVAMISYSTGSSGAGPDVDAVKEAVELAKAAAPELLLDGPLQYDAAVVPSVGASKLPGSPVAGQATVLIFPDLNTGNCTYKAVQRSAGALAIGPVLQGLRKPVNDLSRGALVDDIVNTIIITACQAQ